MSTYFIAEISNIHCGSMAKAKELIRLAKYSGADAVKGQAFRAEDMIGVGSMPDGFYRQCALSYAEYRELMEYGDEIGIPVFYTVLTRGLSYLYKFQDYKKMHAARFEALGADTFRRFDRPNTIVSMKALRPEVICNHATILYATGYNEQIDLKTFKAIRKHYGRRIGVSHHGIKTQDLVELSEKAPLPVIEKHLTDGCPVEFEGVTYRDTIHAANPMEFARLINRING